MKKLLVIGRTFPEPSTTAAGEHILDLMGFFLEESYEILFTSTASYSERSASLEELGIRSEQVLINDESFDQLVHDFQADVVLFDRFITEEQFGWRVSELLPKCVKILDTEDLHFLRRAREHSFKKGIDFSEDQLYTEDAKRELASILRCDLSLVVSSYEMSLLERLFNIPKELLLYLPLLVEDFNGHAHKSYNERQFFVSIGNFYHAPNLDAVKYLKKEIWPAIRQQLPKSELHLYGAYAPEQVNQMHRPEEGFFIEGWVENVDDVIQQAKLCLAPLRFGAGLKGKLISAMLNGTPVITTSIGAEGMYGEFKVPGRIAKDTDEFVDSAVELYSNQSLWDDCQSEIESILNQRFNKQEYAAKFKERLAVLQNNIEGHRKSHFITQIIQHQHLQSTKYLSKWIEEKNK
ncbi:MAG: glycosyltransferase involved in cell wall biosynthesis [Chitinophagales bacterium]|jgi:glycosyltransferase involved in cell wall biosynthesis